MTDCGRACLTDVGVNLLAIRAFCDGYNPVPAAWSYKAPEELLLGIRDQRSDIYSLACTLYAVSVSRFITSNSAFIRSDLIIDIY